ncbi:unnamed protein product [Ceutorhynchus assimilis]|uniref:Uncharacterized protein n=1 Tax=Ceutorhynchus assimilis TaxID=467358 RepID=A0A9N9MXQ2_9CUCU|nr:unnamed protein product [Ceutorhynchus assimilis]
MMRKIGNLVLKKCATQIELTPHSLSTTTPEEPIRLIKIERRSLSFPKMRIGNGKKKMTDFSKIVYATRRTNDCVCCAIYGISSGSTSQRFSDVTC